MDWWKLFSGTFVLIFLAELGDKTQLAALAKTADAPEASWSKWVVFLAASLALVASTFIAVFLGHILQRIVPDERYIRLAAATLFLVFGAMIMYEVIGSFRAAKEIPAVPAEAAGPAKRPGLAGGLALKIAGDIEMMLIQGYRRVAAESSPELAKVLLAIAEEEESHLRRLKDLPETARDDSSWEKEIPVRSGISGRNLTELDQQVLEKLLAQEEFIASFYSDLASRTLIPSVRSVMNRLASEEMAHANLLRKQLS